MAVTATVLVLGLSAAAGCGPDVVGPSWPGPAGPVRPQGGAAWNATGSKTVEYGGYTIEVPASWPVYRLAAQPSRCVRYDTHAIYLGNPGPDQQCPAHLVGRTEAVRIARGVIHMPAMKVAYQRGGGATSRANGRSEQRPLIVRDAAGRELGLTIPRAGLSITATYANAPALVERIVRSVHAADPAPIRPPAPGAPRPTADTPWPAAAHPALVTVPTPDRGVDALPAPPPWRTAQQATAGDHVAPRRAAMDAVAVPAPSGPVKSRAGRAGRPIAGFDTCTAPSIPAMRAWRSYYAAIGIYIGGANSACDRGNLSARWVRQVKAMGWSLIPTYVGLQAPCDHFSGKIKPRWAANEGVNAAGDAVALARGLRLRRHAPIYFDMEAYNSARKRCRSAVLTFLDAWTRRLRVRGYASGVYSSAGSAAEDLGDTVVIGGHRLAKPRSIWFALWDGHANIRGDPYLLASWWPGRRRIKQFRGSRWQKHGGFRLDIDRDEVFGAVY